MRLLIEKAKKICGMSLGEKWAPNMELLTVASMAAAARHDGKEISVAGMIESLLKNGANPNFIWGGKLNPLNFLLEGGDIDGTKLLLSAGSNPNQWPAHGSCPLLCACDVKYPGGDDLDMDLSEKMFNLLLDHGADVNLKARIRGSIWTPLMDASVHGKMFAMRMLLEAGADASFTDSEGWGCLRFLSECIDNSMNRPAHFLVSNANDDLREKIEELNTVISLMIKNGADLNLAETRYGRTPLLAMAGASIGLSSLIYMMENGGNAKIVDTEGNGVLHHMFFNEKFASDDEFRYAIEKCVSMGVDINGKNANGYTPLMCAVKMMNPVGAISLIDLGADHEMLAALDEEDFNLDTKIVIEGMIKAKDESTSLNEVISLADDHAHEKEVRHDDASSDNVRTVVKKHRI